MILDLSTCTRVPRIQVAWAQAYMPEGLGAEACMAEGLVVRAPTSLFPRIAPGHKEQGAD